ncbi:MAG: HEAT repeat domain-containing protein, partial [Kiritimatiellales bacterium]|nr:HEAT repeat domain-containing protein [Kiritimatiellales bacterium]
MDLTNERRLASRAKELGESADVSVFGELAELTRSASPLVRRLAASAFGKLAGIVDSAASVDLLRPLLADAHPQVRQYAAKALGAFGVASERVVSDLRDLYQNPEEKDYVKRSVVAAGKTIREAVRIAEQSAVHHCARCSKCVAPDEYARSQKMFQKTLCDHCFDETYIRRRNFDTRVEVQKTIRTGNGTLVQSDGEQRVADWLAANRIAYRYDDRLRIIHGRQVRPDFYLPEYDIYIEYWGMDTLDYKIGMLVKQQMYQHAGKRLISVYPKDKDRLDEVLRPALFRRVPRPVPMESSVNANNAESL